MAFSGQLIGEREEPYALYQTSGRTFILIKVCCEVRTARLRLGLQRGGRCGIVIVVIAYLSASS